MNKDMLIREVLLESWEQVEKEHLPYTELNIECEDTRPIRCRKLLRLIRYQSTLFLASGDSGEEGEQGRNLSRPGVGDRSAGRPAGRLSGRPGLADGVRPAGR